MIINYKVIIGGLLRQYMTQEDIWLRILEKTSDNEVYVCKEPCRVFREPYLANAIVELQYGDKYFELSHF